MPDQRLEIALHRFEMARVSLVALQRGAIPKGNHHPKIKIPRRIRTERCDRSPRLHPQNARNPAQGMSHANDLVPIGHPLRMLQPHQHHVAHAGRRRGCRAAGRQENRGTKQQQRDWSERPMAFSSRRSSFPFQSTNFGQIRGLANIFGPILRIENFGKQFHRGAKPTSPNEFLYGPRTRFPVKNSTLRESFFRQEFFERKKKIKFRFFLVMI